MSMFFRHLTLLSVLVTLFLSTGCSVFSIYRAPTQQGIEISVEQLDALNTSMTQDDVAQQLGSPLVTDPLMPDLWIYPFIRKVDGRVVQQQIVEVYFDAGRFQRYAIKGNTAEK